MKVVDANLLIYAVNATASQHEQARAWLEAQLTGTRVTGLAWPVLLAFVRIVTNARLHERPLSVAEAMGYVDGWLERRTTVVVAPGSRHAALLRELLTPIGTAGNLATDAHLAAIAIEHGATLCSADRDFGRFSGLRWENPLTAG